MTAPQQLRLCVLAALVAIMVLDRWGSAEPALAAEDRAVLDRLAALYPAPPDAPRENALALDRTALEAWWNQLR